MNFTFFRSYCIAGGSCTLSLCMSLAQATEAVPVIVNPGFEVVDEASKTRLAGWRVAGDGGEIVVDDAVAHSGKGSARITRRDGTNFGTVIQNIDAIPWRGKMLQLEARLKVRDAGVGSIGVWLRADPQRPNVNSFVNSYSHAFVGSSDWVIRRTFLEVPQHAETLVFGAMNGTSGTLWVDDFTFRIMDLADGKPATPEASAYISEAIKKIREVALNAPKVDWPRAERIANAIAVDAATAAQTYEAVTFLLRNLGDNHSFFMPPTTAKQNATNNRTDDFLIKSEPIGDFGYLAVPAYTGGNAERMTAFADELNQRIATLQTQKPCGWIIDLRENGGGNMWPMLTGIAPLLGDGALGYFVAPSYKREWSIKDGASSIAGIVSVAATKKPPIVDQGRAAIAVLTGAKTASSGEAVVVALRGRANTRSFGQPTAGRSTANQGVSLSDGAMMLVTTSVFADRNGNSYGSHIVPDEIVSTPSVRVPLAEDNVVQVAGKWLGAQSNCRK